MRDAETVAGMLCPVCKTGLAMSDRQGVEIDYCPSCRGVWLDRGELDKIIERSNETMGQAAGGAPPAGLETVRRPERGYYGDDDRGRFGGGQHGHRKRRSFLSDLFD